jgi:3-phenylpropionate/trans-cinnamate dioxygenase ferredoxin reductase subunit
MGGVPLSALADGAPMLGTVGGEPVMLVRRGEDVCAIGATCSHYGGPLADGLVVDDTVRCPWHHACFSLRTGEALRAPALNPVPTYEVQRRDGVVFVSGKRTEGPAARRSAAAGLDSVAIVGAGAAGNSVAQELRRLGFSGQVTLIDRDADAPYDRPNLSKDYLAGRAPEEWIPLHPRDYYAGLDIELVVGRTVTLVDPAGRRLTFDDGTTRGFEAIVLATGAEPVQLALAGDRGPRVHYLRTLRDSRAIITAAEGARRAVVVGASFIGLEVAAALRARNLEVHVVAPESRPLERILGRELSDVIKRLHEQHEVTFHLGRTGSAVEPNGLVLDNGQRLAADFIVAGVGVRPATAMAEKAGLSVERGVIVDGFLETRAPGIFAIGDSARWPDPRGSGLVRIEHWVVAQRQGQAVARTLVGDRTRFVDVPFFWSQHYDVSINYVGHAERWDTVEIEGQPDRHDCAVRYRADGRVLALATISRDRQSLETELAMEGEIAPDPGGAR